MLSVAGLKKSGIDPNLPLGELRKQLQARVDSIRAITESQKQSQEEPLPNNVVPFRQKPQQEQPQEPRLELQAPRWAREAISRTQV
jgi:tetraacyldisaccharide-1-P 4'-kinase